MEKQEKSITTSSSSEEDEIKEIEEEEKSIITSSSNEEDEMEDSTKKINKYGNDLTEYAKTIQNFEK